MECNVTSLVCGYNGTGISTMISLEKNSVDSECKVFSRCLVNVGDGTQRFCKENRIKLTSVSCVIISSLTPHNVSGFPGIFLSLSDMGIGSLKVIGPPGLKSYLDLMTPFINRKYPELSILEIDHDTKISELQIDIPYLRINITPISASQAPNRVIAIATCFTPLFNAKLDKKSVSVFPVSYYFDLQQSLSQLSAWSANGGLTPPPSSKANAAAVTSKDVLWASSESDESESSSEDESSEEEDEASSPSRIFIFVPLAVSSHCPMNSRGLPNEEDKHVARLKQMCRRANACGIVFPGELSSGECEFRFCQRTLSAMGTVCRPLFPLVLSGIQQPLAVQIDHQSSNRVQGSSLIFEAVNDFNSRQLIVAVPLMHVWLRPESGMSLSKPQGGSCVQTAMRCAEVTALLTTKVLPYFEDIVAGTHVFDQKIEQNKNCSSNETSDIAVVNTTLVSVSVPPPPFISNHMVAEALRLAMRSNKRKLVGSDVVSATHQGLQVDTTAESFSSSSSASEFKRLEIALSPCWSEDSSAIGSRQSAASRFDFMETPHSGRNIGDDAMQFSPEKRLEESIHDKFLAPTLMITTENERLETAAESMFDVQFPALPNGALSLAPSLGECTPVAIRTACTVPPPSPGDPFTVTFLGTGCATPSKHRNNSCIMVSFAGRGEDVGHRTSLLLDVGEGTAAQIFQSVGGDVPRYDAVLLSIKVIWISHHHADHITGLPQLLEQIQRAHMRVEADSSSFASSEQRALRAVRSKYSLTSQFRRGGSLYEDDSKIMLVAAESVMKYFEFALSAAGLDDLVTLYPVVNTLYAGATSDVAAATHGHVTRLRSVPVQHCHSSYGIVLDLSSGHKVVYSGDCRPSQSLVKAGADCDLLIHEATFDDSMAADALKKKHSTASEARGVAAQMRARHTVLTHFSQRYPVGQTGSAQSEGNTAFPLSSTCSLAFDFLRFSFPSQIRCLPQACSEMVSLLAALETERQLIAQA